MRFALTARHIKNFPEGGASEKVENPPLQMIFNKNLPARDSSPLRGCVLFREKFFLKKELLVEEMEVVVAKIEKVNLSNFLFL
jgi:hypothetical protein